MPQKQFRQDLSGLSGLSGRGGLYNSHNDSFIYIPILGYVSYFRYKISGGPAAGKPGKTGKPGKG